MNPIKIAAINSHLPCPNGCSLSGFLAASFESYLFSINGAEGFIFWLMLAAQLKFINNKRDKNEIKYLK